MKKLSGTSDGERDDEQQAGHYPGWGKRNHRARLIEFGLSVLKYVLPHDAQI
jgi:hypothetical protein